MRSVESGGHLPDPPSGEGRRVAVIAARFNGDVTGELVEGCLAGLTEFSGRALAEVQDRLARDDTNADLAASVQDLTNQQQLLLGRLETMVSLMERLGQNTDSYDAILVEQSDRLSLRALESGVRALQRRELDQVIVGAVDFASDLRAVRGHPAPPGLVADAEQPFIAMDRVDGELGRAARLAELPVRGSRCKRRSVERTVGDAPGHVSLVQHT